MARRPCPACRLKRRRRPKARNTALPAAQNFSHDRDKAYRAILKAVNARMLAVPATVITSLHEFSPAEAKGGAEREAWQLFYAGIAHLKEGAPGGKPGSLHEALSRASIRNASFAAGLGVAPPVFEASDFGKMPEQKTGTAEALFMCKRLLEAAEADLALSRRHIANAMATHNPAEAFGDTPLLIADPELEKIARAAKLKTDSFVPASDLAALRKQMVLSFNFLMDAYSSAGKELLRELKNF